MTLTTSIMMEQILQMTKERRGLEELQMQLKDDSFAGVAKLMALKVHLTSTRRIRIISSRIKMDT